MKLENAQPQMVFRDKRFFTNNQVEANPWLLGPKG